MTRCLPIEGSPEPGHAILAFRRTRAGRTVLATALAASPLRLLTPRNHGDAAWIYLASLGGGLVDGDRLRVRATVEEGALALIGTQASTKVYRSPRGCSQRLEADVAGGGALVVVPDPVVCFAGARYTQQTDVRLAPDGSLFLLDGYTCGRAARGERWQFERYASRTTITRGERIVFVDATRLDPSHGSIAERMGRFDVVLSIVVFGPKLAAVRAAMLESSALPIAHEAAVVAASPLGNDGAILRVAAGRFENATQRLRTSFAALAAALGDDPFARKW